jgi:hypothetical protein
MGRRGSPKQKQISSPEAAQAEARLRELEAENKRLQRTVKRLTKQLVRQNIQIELAVDIPDEPVEVPQAAPEPTPSKEPVDSCPKCGGVDLTVFDAGIKKFVICKDCRWRKPANED